MKEQIVNLKTNDGTMEVFVACPDGPGPFPVVVQIMDALGMREEMRGHARRVAAWGYYVLSPDVFYRIGLKGPLNPAVPEEMAKIRSAMSETTNARVISDIEDTLKLAAGDKHARTGPVGIYGYCMGGRLTFMLCQALGGRVAAAASIHPGGLVSDQPTSPHRNVDKVKAEVYFGIADKDPTATPEQMVELEKALKAAGITYQLEWHPGALHGYMMPSRGTIYNQATAEKVWGRLQALLARKL